MSDNPILKELYDKKRKRAIPRVNYAEGGEVDPSDMDPQSAIASQGFSTLGSAVLSSTPVQNAITGKGLSDAYHDAVAAGEGDQQAQANVANRSLGTAMGSLGEENQAARMARAEKMGFDTNKTWYHGTPNGEIKEFDPSNRGATFLTQDPKFANKFTGNPDNGEAANILPVHTSVQNTFDPTKHEHAVLLKKELAKQFENMPFSQQKHIVGGKYGYANHAIEDIQAKGTNWKALEQENVLKAIKDAGFDSFHVREGGRKNLGVFNSSHIRSKFAQFDPKQAKSGNLSFAEGGPVSASDEPEGIDDYLGHNEPITPESGQSAVPISPTLSQSSGEPEPEGIDSYLGSGSPEASNEYADMAKAYGEGLGQGIAGPLAPIAEQAAGVSNEDIRRREEEHPYMHAAGEMTGLLSPISGPGMLASKLAAKAVGKTILSKMGAAALQTMALGTSDELSKLVESDPNQSAQSAAAHIGLSGMLGGIAAGSLGAVNKLWASAYGQKASQFLGSFKDKATELLNGEPNVYDLTENPSIVADLATPAAKAGSKMAEAAIGKLKDIGEAAGAGAGAWAGDAIGGTEGAFVGMAAGKALLGPTFEKGLKAVIKPVMNGDFNPEALKSTLDYLKSVDAGQKLMNSAAQNLFSEKPVLKDSDLPSDAELSKLDKQIQSYGKDPESLTNTVASQAQGYLPDHGTASGQIAGAAVSYFNSIRPGGQEPQSPLDSKIPPSASDMTQYMNQLAIGQQPLTVIAKAKAGTITPTDIKTLSTVYPDLYQSMQNQLTNAMIGHISKGGTVPYSTRIGMSMLMAHPMDSTMTPAGIQAAQSVGANNSQQQQGQGGGKPPSETNTKNLSKIGAAAATPLQARGMQRAKGANE